MTGVVVGVDPSPAGRAALDWALREAVSAGVDLHAVRAWSFSAYAGEALMYAATVEPLEEAAAQQEADEELKLATERVAGADTVVCTATAAPGPAAAVLTRCAEGARVLVVGSGRHRALSRAVLGSVSASVLHQAAVPVLVVPAPGEDDATAPRVVVGVDHSAASLRALAHGAEQARRWGVPLVPVYVHKPLELPRGEEHAPHLGLLEDSERHHLEAAAEAAGGVDVRASVLIGNPVVALLGAVRPQDLLVVGTRGRGGFTGLVLGSTSSQLTQHAPCPVLVVPA